MPMRSLTLVILTALLTAGLPAKAEITLEALEAGSGVPWPQAPPWWIRSPPALGRLTSKNPTGPLPFPSTRLWTPSP